MVNYKDGKIYKIVDDTTGRFYIGSTCNKSLDKRLQFHTNAYNSYKRKQGHYVSSYDVIKNGRYHIALIDTATTRHQLLAKEGHYIDTMKPNVNAKRSIDKLNIK